MSGEGADNPQYKAANYDPNDIAAFMNTKTAQQWSPEQIAMLHDAYHVSQGPNGLGVVSGKGDPGSSTGVFQNVDLSLVNTFEQWVGSNSQTQANWKKYSDLISQNEGGEGDQTVTAGAAQSQRNQILGNLSNEDASSPAIGIGSIGMTMKNGKPVAPGGGKA